MASHRAAPLGAFRRPAPRRIAGTAIGALALATALTATAGAAGAAAGTGATGAAAGTGATGAAAGTGASIVPKAPPVTVLDDSGAVAPGDVFLSPTQAPGSTASTYASGPEIVDNQGRPVWFKPLPKGITASDFRVQTYEGQPVLTWWEGSSLNGVGHGEGTDYIANTHYQVIATVRAGNDYFADQHEFQLTPQGNALVTIYTEEPADLTSVGGPADGEIYDGLVQEINVKTGKVLFQWDAAQHVPFTDSHEPLPTTPGTPWDFFHVNAVHQDTDGNLLVSARHTWTVYKVDSHTGAVIWELGGKQSSFKLGPGVAFAWQHDPYAINGNTVQIFDNESDGTPVRPFTRIITVGLNTTTMTATLENVVVHPDHLSAASQGDAQDLPNGDLFVGWGALGRYSEFNATGQLIYDVLLPSGYDTYRAWKMPWDGTPLTSPTAVVKAKGAGAVVRAVWDGATSVATWEVLGGSSASQLRPLASAAWDGLSTSVTLPSRPSFVRVVAYDAAGHAIGQSSLTHTPAT